MDDWRTPQEDACLTPDEVIAICEGRLQLDTGSRIDRHLDGCNDCVRLLSEALHDFEPARVPEGVAGPLLFVPGMKIGGRYRITALVGRGGMGEVYEARDMTTGERVALKTVSSTSCDDPRAMQRLAREMQLARQIAHPNVCGVHDFGEHRYEGEGSASVHYLTMDLMDGETLRRRLMTAPLSIEEASSYARQLLAGLAALHAAGVIHRDLKPENIMLRRTRSELSAIIMDFGLAYDAETPDGGLSGRDRLSGTAAYMAPEQLMGSEPIRPAADVYSFGLVLFEMLIGRLPFAGALLREVAMKRVTEDCPRMSSLVQGLPAWLDEFVARCLCRAPVDRFENGHAALVAFDRGMAPSVA